MINRASEITRFLKALFFGHRTNYRAVVLIVDIYIQVQFGGLAIGTVFIVWLGPGRCGIRVSSGREQGVYKPDQVGVSTGIKLLVIYNLQYIPVCGYGLYSSIGRGGRKSTPPLPRHPYTPFLVTVI